MIATATHRSAYTDGQKDNRSANRRDAQPKRAAGTLRSASTDGQKERTADMNGNDALQRVKRQTGDKQKNAIKKEK